MDNMSTIAVASIVVAGITTGFGTMGPALAEGKAVATALIVQGLRVNAVAPGHVDTSTLKGTLDESRRVIANQTPAGRLARPDEIAATVAFLASDDASYYVGATLTPNGGLVTAV